LKQQARVLEKIPEKEFDDYMNSLGLPHQQFFFVDKETLPVIRDNHQATHDQIHGKQKKHESMIELIRKSTHIALFGAYPLD